MGKKFGESAPSGKWYDEYPKAPVPQKHSKTDVEMLELKAEAKRHLESETSVFQLKQSKSRDSEAAWLRTALSQGTTSDKVAAAIVLVQDSPKYNLAKLVTLVNQVKVSKHNQSSMIITSLRDLFLSDLLHPKYKLCRFEDQNLDELDKETTEDGVVKTDATRKKLLVHWYFEDQLREQYERFVSSLAAIAADTVDSNRETAISVMTDLLIGNAEQEQKLLELIVNKVGDPNNKVGSRAVFCLNKLLNEHPNMKSVVLKGIEKLLFRKNVGPRAQYYAICLLTQFVLGKEDEEIATNLIEVYFAFFKACLKKGEPDSRMMAAILTGVNRAYPFTKEQSDKLKEHIDAVYKVVHIGSFNVSLNALNLLHQITGRDEDHSNRFYSTFYRKLLDPQIGVANKRAIFLNLLYRVLQKDTNMPRLYAFVKRILQVTLYFPPNMACATLYVVSKVIQGQKRLKNILLHATIPIKVELEEDQAKPESTDEDSDHQPDDSKDNSVLLANIVAPLKSEEGGPEANPDADVKIEKDLDKQYDPFCRNPLYAGITWNYNTELETLARHYHPSVALFARTILEGRPVDYTGDPLEDLTLMRFLDRYVFKNPKRLEDKKVQRKNDPLARRAGYAAKGVRSLPVDSASYLNEQEDRIPVDELFLYRYLKTRTEGGRIPKAEDEDEEDLESVNSEEFNEALDRLGSGKDFEELDIAADIQTGRTRKGADEEDLQDESDDDKDEKEDVEDPSEDLQDDLSDADLQDLSDLDLDDIDGDDLSEIEFDEDLEEVEPTKKGSKGKQQQKTKGKKKDLDSNIFVSAEKFAEMLEEEGRRGRRQTGTEAFSDMDGASSKQIDWEIQRHQKLRGRPFHGGKRKGPGPFKKTSKKVKR